MATPKEIRLSSKVEENALEIQELLQLLSNIKATDGSIVILGNNIKAARIEHKNTDWLESTRADLTNQRDFAIAAFFAKRQILLEAAGIKPITVESKLYVHPFQVSKEAQAERVKLVHAYSDESIDITFKPYKNKPGFKVKSRLHSIRQSGATDPNLIRIKDSVDVFGFVNPTDFAAEEGPNFIRRTIRELEFIGDAKRASSGEEKVALINLNQQLVRERLVRFTEKRSMIPQGWDFITEPAGVPNVNTLTISMPQNRVRRFRYRLAA